MTRIRRRHRPGDAVSSSGTLLSSSAIIDTAPGVRRNLIVEGRIDAKIPLHAHGVSVTAIGRITGDIYAATIRVEGEVIGDLFAEAEVRVCSSGSVRGRITSPNVIIEDGARFKGQVGTEERVVSVLPGLGAQNPTIVIA